MNIFVLDTNPIVAAKYHHDRHCIKMILETAQLLSTAHRILDGHKNVGKRNGRKYTSYPVDNLVHDSLLYKATHINHPSAVWVRENSENYKWTYYLFRALLDEYTHRFEKQHKCESLDRVLSLQPKNIKYTSHRTEFALAMPEEYKSNDSVFSYRTYYNSAKEYTKSGKPNKYTKRTEPNWLTWKSVRK